MVATTQNNGTQINSIKGTILVEGLYQNCIYGLLEGYRYRGISTSPVQEILLSKGQMFAKTYSGSVYNLKGNNNILMDIIQTFM